MTALSKQEQAQWREGRQEQEREWGQREGNTGEDEGVPEKVLEAASSHVVSPP
jgi:hypothetical protein